MLARLGILALGQRVDGPDLLAIALELGETRLDPLALLVLQRLGSRPQLIAEGHSEPLELGGALVPMPAQLGGLDLRHGHRLARLPELPLEPELLL